MPAHYPSVYPLWGGYFAHLVAGGQGSWPWGSPPVSSTPYIPLTRLAPPGSDSASPPGVRFPASVPAKEGVGDPCPSVLLHLPALGSSDSQFHSSDFPGLLQKRLAQGQGEESSDRNSGSQRELESSRNPEVAHQPGRLKTGYMATDSWRGKRLVRSKRLRTLIRDPQRGELSLETD